MIFVDGELEMEARITNDKQALELKI